MKTTDEQLASDRIERAARAFVEAHAHLDAASIPPGPLP